MFMKVILVICLLLSQLSAKKQIANQYKLNLPSYESRSKVYGILNRDTRILAKTYSQGITPYYGQMLQNPKNYFISQDIKQKSIDLEKEVQLYRRMTKQDQAEEINYGEINEKLEEEQKKQKYTSDYDQMLVDPSLRFLTLGVHPELNTDETRVIQSDYEDPYIQMSDEDLQLLKKQQQKKMGEYRNKIQLFLSKMENKASKLDSRNSVNDNKANKVDSSGKGSNSVEGAIVSEHEKQVLNEIRSFVDKNSELKDLKERVGLLVQKLSKKPESVDGRFMKQDIRYDTSYQIEMDKQYGQQQQQQQQQIESVVKNNLIEKAKKQILEKARKDIEKEKDADKKQTIQFEKDLGDDQLFDDLEQANKKILKKEKQKGGKKEEQKGGKKEEQKGGKKEEQKGGKKEEQKGGKKEEQKGGKKEEQKRGQNERLKEIGEQGDRLVDMIDELEESSKEKKKKKKKGKKTKI